MIFMCAQPVSKNFLHMLVRGTNFCACPAKEEITAHTKNIIQNDFSEHSASSEMFKILNIFATYKIFKNVLLQPIGTIGIQFLQKNEKRIFHACVPLRIQYKTDVSIS